MNVIHMGFSNLRSLSSHRRGIVWLGGSSPIWKMKFLVLCAGTLPKRWHSTCFCHLSKSQPALNFILWHAMCPILFRSFCSPSCAAKRWHTDVGLMVVKQIKYVSTLPKAIKASNSSLPDPLMPLRASMHSSCHVLYQTVTHTFLKLSGAIQWMTMLRKI